MFISILACIVSIQPLVSTGADGGIWFIGDRNPAQIQFDTRAKGMEFSICARTSKTAYVSLQSFLRRPVGLLIFNNEIWFADQREGVALYAMRKDSMGALHATLQTTFETQMELKGMHQWGDAIAISSGGESLQITTFEGGLWKELPELLEKDATAVVYKNDLLAFAPSERGVRAWRYGESNWESEGQVELHGVLVAVVQKADWLLLVTEHEGQGAIWGLQQKECIQMASFTIPKGRWAVLPSPEGLSLMSVERNGTTTVMDINWPSGSLSPAIELTLEPLHETSFLESVALFMPMFLFAGFVYLLFRKGDAKSTQK